MQESAQPRESSGAPFLRKLDWSAFWTACALSFAVYFFTLAPTVTLEDAGELAVAGDYLGVPHPPGYPIWTMLVWVATKIFSFVTFRGQPNPAWSIALVSALFGALASGITAMLICRSGSDILRRSRLISHDMDGHTEGVICWLGGVVSSLLFAFTPIMWSQAIIVEVYSLNAFFLTLILLFIYMWIQRPSDRTLLAAAFLFGLGLTNYQVILLAGLALAICIMLRDFELFRDFVFAALPYAAIYALMKLPLVADAGGKVKPILPAIAHPLHATCYVYMFLNFGWMIAIYFLFPRGRTVAPSILLAQLGIAFYAYMPIVSDLRNPPMNWGYPRTWDGFLHAITRGQYEKIIPAYIFSLRFISQIGTYLADLTINYRLPVALIGFLPFAAWHVTIGGRKRSALPLAVALGGCAVVLSVFGKWLPVYKLPALGVMILMAVGGLTIIVARMRAILRAHLVEPAARWWERLTAVIVLLAAAAGFIMLVARDVRNVTKPLRLAQAPLKPEQIDKITHECLVIAGLVTAILALIALAYWLTRQEWFHLSVDEGSQRWMMATSIAFVALGLGLIALANIKMDVQDTFIQRVKFISSHALFAFWIGYGIIFLLSLIDGWAGRHTEVKWLSIAVVAALPLVPIYMNAYNRELIRVYGAAEQNGHDFGWQFGNYQLRGADAISEELDADEEPLPNPMFPPEMTRDAIFYGGTDPGRFVPTYMIYSARVREDVYLITQNALADNTYLNVMRDLYGDQIWIPAQQDSALAFRRYVEDVRSGKRQPHADLKIEDGRVQVSGALGVMEINGILAEMIFEHNNWKHDFYVEESYVIKWMYPYLTPHGLIMKINRDTGQLKAKVIQSDMDFWDWYTRRLHGNPKFLRDIVARKSFSKLRGAIAGLYSDRGRYDEAELAFQQARTLYPLSPEANFRLVQEVMMRQRRYDEAKDLMRYFGEQDPANIQVSNFLRQIEKIENLDSRIIALEEKRRNGMLNVDQALALAGLYRQARQKPHFVAVMKGIIGTENVPWQLLFQASRMLHEAKEYDLMGEAITTMLSRMPDKGDPNIYLGVAKMYADAKRPDGMLTAVEAYLKLRPNDWKAWLDLASVNIGLKKPEAARRALAKARSVGGFQAEEMIRKDRRFSSLLQRRASDPSADRMDLINIPGVTPPSSR